MEFVVHPKVRAEFAKTFVGTDAGQLYVHCPDCHGTGLVYLYRDVEDARSGNYFTCPTCGGTAEADAQKAIEFIRDWQEQHAEELDARPDLAALEPG